MKTDEETLRLFDENYPKFKWFIEEYSKPELLTLLESTRERKDVAALLTILNGVWFYLPDNRFNIIENPKGWTEFLDIIED